jgi:hypothetical protein
MSSCSYTVHVQVFNLLSLGRNTEITDYNFNLCKLVTDGTRSTSAPSRMTEFTVEVNTIRSSYFTIVYILSANRFAFRL